MVSNVRSTKIVFWTDLEQMYCSPGSIIIKPLNYRQYLTKQKLAQIQNKGRQNNIICAVFNRAPPWWSTATFWKTKVSLFLVTSYAELLVSHIKNFSFPRRRSSIASFDRDSVFLKTSSITNHKYLKGRYIFQRNVLL